MHNLFWPRYSFYDPRLTRLTWHAPNLQGHSTSKVTYQRDSHQHQVQVTGAVGWRKDNIKYKKNEVFLDIVEQVCASHTGSNNCCSICIKPTAQNLSTINCYYAEQVGAVALDLDLQAYFVCRKGLKLSDGAEHGCNFQRCDCLLVLRSALSICRVVAR